MEIRIRFTSRVAIASLRGEYLLQWHDAGEPHHGEAFQPIGEAPISRYAGMIPQGENIREGQTLTATIVPRGLNAGAPGLAPGMTTGRVSLQYGDGTRMQAAEDTVHIPVRDLHDQGSIAMAGLRLPADGPSTMRGPRRLRGPLRLYTRR